MDTARFVGLAAGAGSGVVLAQFPQFDLVTFESTPPGNPQPGTFGGGGIPSTATSAQVLALVPVGLTAVVTFPPYATPRTYPADSVIFSEVPNFQNVVQRKKRSLLSHLRYIWPFGRQRSNHRKYYQEQYSGGDEPEDSIWAKIASGK